MPEISAQHGRGFEDNLEILFDEIALAAQWGRPSLLLAVHKSKFGQEKAEQALEERLRTKAFEVVRIMVNDQRSDLAQQIRDAGPRANPVYFISNIDWGGGDDGRAAYRALNLHREYFVEGSIRAVFWLTVNEAANLPRFAPDFWAFRHRVVEFVSQRAPREVKLPAGVLAWDIQRSADPFESPESGIQARRELLERLPDSMEALSTKAEVLGGIGFLHWIMGATAEAQRAFESGLALARDHELPELKASLLNAMGILRYESGEHEAALKLFQEGLIHRSSGRALLINSSAVQCVLGRIQEALTTAKRAVRASPLDADTWNRLAYIQLAAGRLDEAITWLAKAVELAPRVASHRRSLAVLYAQVDRPDDVKAQLQRARELDDESGTEYVEILRAATLGEPEKGLELLRAAVTAGRIPKHNIQRDPNLHLLFEAGQLAEAAA